MKKIINIMLMVMGIVLMGIISLMFSFTEVEIPRVMYMCLWLGCLGIIRFASLGFGLER